MRSPPIAAIGLLTVVLAPWAACAQTQPWVDPPAETPPTPAPAAPDAVPAPPEQEGAPSRPPTPASPLPPPAAAAEAPAPEAAPPPAGQAGTPQRPARTRTPAAEADQQAPSRESRDASREKAAEDLLAEYLAAWSAPNEEALAAMPEFYAPSVSFYGKVRPVASVLAEKQRFIRRWPSREYTPRRDTTGVACNPSADACTVRSVFDFNAFDPARNKHSRGVATLELVVRFDRSGTPLIVSESSIVHGRGGDPQETGTLSDDTP